MSHDNVNSNSNSSSTAITKEEFNDAINSFGEPRPSKDKDGKPKGIVIRNLVDLKNKKALLIKIDKLNDALATAKQPVRLRLVEGKGFDISTGAPKSDFIWVAPLEIMSADDIAEFSGFSD